MNEMTLTPEKLDEIEQLAELATPGPWYYAGCNTVHDANHDEVAHPCDMGHDCATARYIAACDPATVRELVRAAKERDAQAARIAELEYRVKRALSGDLYALLTDIQNGIDAPGHKDMANSAIQRIDALLTILEGDEA